MGVLSRFLPDLHAWLTAGGSGLAVGFGAGLLAGWARARIRVGAPYTRKIFHFLVFSGALFVQRAWGTQGTVAYGSVVAALVLGAVLLGDGFPLYEALARPTDRPHRTLLVVVPLLATALGGVIGNVAVGDFATVGYLVAGWGDAVAEPVGTRWGRHPYRVPTLAGVPARRSLEGSAAVLLAGTLAAWTALALMGFGGWRTVAAAAVCGIVSTGVEAVSHHGLDNLTLQIAASLTAFLLLRR